MTEGRGRESVRTSRLAESRIADYDMASSMEYRSPLDIPQELRKDGFEQHWATMSIRGKDNFDVEEKARQGFRMISTDHCPQFAVDPLGRNELGNKFYTCKGQVLMEREKEIGERKRARDNQIATDKVRAILDRGHGAGGVKQDGNPMFATPGREMDSF